MTKIKRKDIVIPDHSKPIEANPQKTKKKEVSYEDLRKKHYDRQTKSTRKSMKKNEKLSRKNTPVHKRKMSLFNKMKYRKTTKKQSESNTEQ